MHSVTVFASEFLIIFLIFKELYQRKRWIDKADVRTVIHWDLPSSLEDYFQEAGRAGRDGHKAFAIVLYNDNDVKKTLSGYPEEPSVP